MELVGAVVGWRLDTGGLAGRQQALTQGCSTLTATVNGGQWLQAGVVMVRSALSSSAGGCAVVNRMTGSRKLVALGARHVFIPCAHGAGQRRARRRAGSTLSTV